MLAVDPARQSHGVGLALTDHATEWLRARGMRVARIGTGGDVGHAAARRLYERRLLADTDGALLESALTRHRSIAHAEASARQSLPSEGVPAHSHLRARTGSAAASGS